MVTTINAQTSSSLDRKAAVDGTPMFGNSISTPSSLTPGPLGCPRRRLRRLAGPHAPPVPVSAGFWRTTTMPRRQCSPTAARAAAICSSPATGSFTYTSWKGFSGSTASSMTPTVAARRSRSCGYTSCLSPNFRRDDDSEPARPHGAAADCQHLCAFFGRGPDADGFEFWVDQFQAGLPSQGPESCLPTSRARSASAPRPRRSIPSSPTRSARPTPPSALSSTASTTTCSIVPPDAAGLAYWTNQIKQTLEAGQFVGSVLVSIIGGAGIRLPAGHHHTDGQGGSGALSTSKPRATRDAMGPANSDRIAATQLLDPVTSDPSIGVKNADALVEAHG